MACYRSSFSKEWYYTFQDDNAPIHRAQIVQEFKVQNNMHSMVWPAQSPDLDIIENIWLRLKRELKNGNETFMCKNQLEAAIRRIWVNNPTDYVQSLYRSIPRRIHRVLRSKGYITKYQGNLKCFSILFHRFLFPKRHVTTAAILNLDLY